MGWGGCRGKFLPSNSSSFYSSCSTFSPAPVFTLPAFLSNLGIQAGTFDLQTVHHERRRHAGRAPDQALTLADRADTGFPPLGVFLSPENLSGSVVAFGYAPAAAQGMTVEIAGGLLR